MKWFIETLKAVSRSAGQPLVLEPTSVLAELCLVLSVLLVVTMSFPPTFLLVSGAAGGLNGSSRAGGRPSFGTKIPGQRTH